MLHRVDEISEDLFLFHGNRSKVLADEIGELCFVHTRSSRNLVELFVATQGLHLEIAEVNFRIFAIRITGVIRMSHGPLAL